MVLIRSPVVSSRRYRGQVTGRSRGCRLGGHSCCWV